MVQIGIEEWLTALQAARAESEGDYDSMRETAFFLHRRYGGRALLYNGRAWVIIVFMQRFRTELISDGYIKIERRADFLQDDLIEAFAIGSGEPRSRLSVRLQ